MSTAADEAAALEVRLANSQDHRCDNWAEIAATSSILDGHFTAAELREIADLMDKLVEYRRCE